MLPASPVTGIRSCPGRHDERVTIARFKDLCVDGTDALALAHFWRETLGGTVVDQGDGSACVEPPDGHGVNEVLWANLVPEPHSVKTRVHLDLWLPRADPEPLRRAGASLLREPGGDIHWWVLADPGGNEFCAFPPEEGSPVAGRGQAAGIMQLVLDCGDPQAQAAWWAAVLGGQVDQRAEYGPRLVGAENFPWEFWLFQPVPEPKRVKNRMHWDVLLADQRPDTLVARGATVLREPGGDIHWWVLAGPEGNEFCGFPAS